MFFCLHSSVPWTKKGIFKISSGFVEASPMSSKESFDGLGVANGLDALAQAVLTDLRNDLAGVLLLRHDPPQGYAYALS